MPQGIPFLVLIIGLLWSCVSAKSLVPVANDPPEVRTHLEKNGHSMDTRAATVQIAAQFVRAVRQHDGADCWFLLDLRAAAAWQAAQDGKSGAGPKNITHLLQPLLPKGQPTEIRSKGGTDKKEVQLVYADGKMASLELVLARGGWRVLYLPPDGILPELARDPRTSQTAPPIDFTEDVSPGRAQRQPMRPMGGY